MKSGYELNEGSFIEQAETPQEAICYVSLKAKGVDILAESLKE